MFRLWLWYRLKKETEITKGSFRRLQESYDALCRGEPNNQFQAGQFSWNEILVPLRFCRYTFRDPLTRRRITTFLELAEKLKTVQATTNIEEYAQYIKWHTWCYDFMKNRGKCDEGFLELNPTDYMSLLLRKYNLNLDTSPDRLFSKDTNEAKDYMKNFMKKNGLGVDET